MNATKERTTPPAEGEFTPYFGRYIGLVPPGDVIETMRSQFRETSALLRAIDRQLLDQFASRGPRGRCVSASTWAARVASRRTTSRSRRLGVGMGAGLVGRVRRRRG